MATATAFALAAQGSVLADEGVRDPRAEREEDDSFEEGDGVGFDDPEREESDSDDSDDSDDED